MVDRVTHAQIGHIFSSVTRAGAASRRPYAEKFKCGRRGANAAANSQR